jgi:hypothetical protein
MDTGMNEIQLGDLFTFKPSTFRFGCNSHTKEFIVVGFSIDNMSVYYIEPGYKSSIKCKCEHCKSIVDNIQRCAGIDEINFTRTYSQVQREEKLKKLLK